MRWRLWAIAVAAAAGIAALTGAAWYAATRPTVLRVAVADRGDDVRLLSAAAQLLRRDKAPIRLKLVPAADPAAAAEALDSRQADLAVVRSDVAVPAAGETVAILQRGVALIITPDTGLADVGGLAGRKVAIVGSFAADEKLLDAILAHYEVPSPRVRRETVPPAQLSEALAHRGFDAVFIVGAPTGAAIADAVRSVAAAGGRPVFLPVSEAEAMALRRPDLESTEVVRGAFGGTPPRPAEPLTTLAVTWRLMAHATLDSAAVAELTRRLFTMRADLARSVPAADRLEAPDLDKDAPLPVHPGAADYFQDEEQTFMERYGDWIYVAAMLLGFGASAIAAVAARMRSRTHRHAHRIEHLLALVSRARGAASPEDLAAIEAEADAVVAETLTAAADPPDAARLAALSFALDQVRHAVADRRRQIHPGEPPADLAWRVAK
ncbi:TAXI family TRAP transporter solute-binding subunit [Alsobacter sp. R-9]